MSAKQFKVQKRKFNTVKLAFTKGDKVIYESVVVWAVGQYRIYAYQKLIFHFKSNTNSLGSNLFVLDCT